MAKMTLAQMAERMAALQAEVDALRAQPAKPAVRTWASAEERAKGEGFACAAKVPCARKDLKTAGNDSHDPASPRWHTPRDTAFKS